MKAINIAAPVLLGGILLASTSAFAQFSGYFSGYYAPVNWASSRYGNPLYQDTAFVYPNNAPSSLEIDGAVNTTGQTSTPYPPVSVFDFTITLSGTGLQPVAFNYSFSGVADAYDAAYLIYDGTQVATLSTLRNGTVQSFFDNTSYQGGHTFGFRVVSNNDNLADRLIITSVPEPSALTLLGLGAGALFCRARYRKR